jgi:hypothetical protein
MTLKITRAAARVASGAAPEDIARYLAHAAVVVNHVVIHGAAPCADPERDDPESPPYGPCLRALRFQLRRLSKGQSIRTAFARPKPKRPPKHQDRFEGFYRVVSRLSRGTTSPKELGAAYDEAVIEANKVGSAPPLSKPSYQKMMSQRPRPITAHDFDDFDTGGNFATKAQNRTLEERRSSLGRRGKQ